MKTSIVSFVTALTIVGSTAVFSTTNDANSSDLSSPSSNAPAPSVTSGTTGLDNHVDIQLKTSDGQLINAIIDETDLKGLKQGDTLQYQGSEQDNASNMPTNSGTSTNP
ncbi:Uncharacterised protein [Legionella lansingensis]|uniref:Uncharacterized protein n=1 Tax=Legionella lansingensis TaxID=45067 RepID=A0A0W0VZB8_9GAMM|nr:hypothetical protein [Legionella lansingensis]KTD25432.1 hypothetical protein Llan_0178 [Legionella lansingensis]SNV51435.1 Uncharacterised protein [Legionella lansingensis]